jgi:predicted O-methyltransferase YrrM
MRPLCDLHRDPAPVALWGQSRCANFHRVGLPEQIVALGRHSRSAELAHTIKETMSGVTWHCHYHLLYDLRTMLGPEKKVYLEIGVYDGGSLSFMMQHPYETELHGVDPLVLPGQVDHTFANVKTFNAHRRRVTVHQKYSYDPELWRDLDGLVIDLLFIDGDHQASSVIKDFELGSPRVAQGGFIVFDDYLDPQCSPDVRPAVDLIVERIQRRGYPGQYDVIGCVPNVLGADPADMEMNSTFVLRKRA